MDLKIAKELCLSEMEKAKVGKIWKFEWINKKHTFGYCSYARKTIALCIPYVLVNDEKTVLNTILHEIAHAKCHKHGHNKYWKTWCVKLGAIPERLVWKDYVPVKKRLSKKEFIDFQKNI